MHIISDRFSATGAVHLRATLCFQPPAQAALGRGWAVTDRPSRRSGRQTGPLVFYKDVIIIAGPVVKSAIACVKLKLGYRRIYRTRANVFLRRYAPKLEKTNPIFPNFSKVHFGKLGKLGLEKKFEKLWYSPGPHHRHNRTHKRPSVSCCTCVE